MNERVLKFNLLLIQLSVTYMSDKSGRKTHRFDSKFMSNVIKKRVLLALWETTQLKMKRSERKYDIIFGQRNSDK